LAEQRHFEGGAIVIASHNAGKVREFVELLAPLGAEVRSAAELGLAELKPEAPWHGYDLGEWTDEMEAMATRATEGDYWETGRAYAQRRRGDIEMNTEIRALMRDEDDDV